LGDLRDLKEKNHLEDLRVDGMIILKWIFKKCDGMDWIDVAHERDRSGSCECHIEPSGFIKCGEFPGELRTC
jgi:hypothetical protein